MRCLRLNTQTITFSNLQDKFVAEAADTILKDKVSHTEILNALGVLWAKAFNAGRRSVLDAKGAVVSLPKSIRP